jgi:hypothetical protein
MNDKPRYYLDVTRCDPQTGVELANVKVFGPFTNLEIAEEAMAKLCARLDILEVRLRNPDA